MSFPLRGCCSVNRFRTRANKQENDVSYFLYLYRTKPHRVSMRSLILGADSVCIPRIMMSPHEVIYAAPGQRIGRWRLHIMVFSPGASLKDFALTDASRHFGMNSPGSGTAHLLVVVPNWADSTSMPARPGSAPPPELEIARPHHR